MSEDEPRKQTREVSRFWLALAFLGSTMACVPLKAPESLMATLATCTAMIAAFYFGEKGKKTVQV